MKHLDLDLQTSFEDKRLSGVADLTIARARADASKLVLDTRDLTIRQIWWMRGATDLVPLRFTLGARDPMLGSPLTIDLPAEAERAGIHGAHFLPDAARGFRPAVGRRRADRQQDRSLPVHAVAGHPRAQLDSAAGFAAGAHDLQRDHPRAARHARGDERREREQSAELAPNGVYKFDMPQAIPSYLIALGVGKLEFRATGPRTGVYAESSLVEAAAKEFSETEQMIQASEKLFGPYRWGRYDLLILPPSFPFGGMENPRLSFITPTVIAGDRSLTALIAHELAHSWSGNLVTNATWRDLWLNEGFTVFLQGRIMQAVYGERREAMEEMLDLATLRDELATLPPSDQVLAIDLRGRDPDDVFTQVPYIKGALFISWLGSRFGADARRQVPARLLRQVRVPEHLHRGVPRATSKPTCCRRSRTP